MANQDTNTYRFELRIGVSGTNRDTWEVITSFPTGREASDAKARWAEVMNRGEQSQEVYDSGDNEYRTIELAGRVLAIVRVLDTGEAEGDANWREREAERFASGRYKRVPWDHESQAYQDANVDGDWPQWVEAYPGHFVHIAESDARKVSFTPDDIKGRKDKQTVLSVRDYLERYYSDRDGQCDCCNHLSYMCRREREQFASQIDGNAVTVEFASTADEFERIYVECGNRSRHEVNSCMSATVDGYASSIHPTRAYAAGDLKLAYIRDGDGYIWSRCLVWPSALAAGRAYGTDSLALKNGLRALGYTKFGSEYLDGARFLKIKAKRRGSDMYVVPYIDGNQRFANATLDDGSECFCIDSDGPYHGNRTDGLGEARELPTCAHCDEQIDGDVFNVEDEDWCYDCMQSDTTSCRECNQYYHEESDSLTVTGEGHNVCDDCLPQYYTQVPSSDDQYYRNRSVSNCDTCSGAFLRSSLSNGRCETCISEHGDAELVDAGWRELPYGHHGYPAGVTEGTLVEVQGHDDDDRPDPSEARHFYWGGVARYRVIRDAPDEVTPVPDSDGWIAWNGSGEMPVPEGTPLDIDFNDQSSLRDCEYAHCANWRDVARYRLSSQPSQDLVSQVSPALIAF